MINPSLVNEEQIQVTLPYWQIDIEVLARVELLPTYILAVLKLYLSYPQKGLPLDNPTSLGLIGHRRESHFFRDLNATVSSNY